MKNIFKLFLSAILLSCTVLTTQAADSQATEATVLRVQGSATVLLPGASDSVPLTVGMTVPTGATITTGAGSEVDLKPFAGGMTAVKANTRVDIEELSVNKSRSGKVTKQTAKLNLRSGNLISTLDPARKAINNYGIRTPKGVAAARGTVYAVSVNQTGSSVATLTGTVTLTPVLPGGGFGVPIVVDIGTGMVISGAPGQTAGTPVSLSSLIADEAGTGNTGEGSMTEAISQAVTTVSKAVASGDSSAVGASGTSAASVLAAVVNVASSANPTQASNFASQAVTAVTSPTSGISATAAATAAAAVTEAAVQGAVKTTVANGGDASAVSTITNTIASSAVTAASASGTSTTAIATAAAQGAVTATQGTTVAAPTTVTVNGTTTTVTPTTTTTTTTSTPITTVDTTLISPSS